MKKFLIVLLSIIMSFAFITLTISFSFKEVLVKQFSTAVTELVKDEMSEFNLSNEEVDELFSEKDGEKIMSKLLDVLLLGTVSDEVLDDFSIYDDLNNFIQENKEILISKYNVDGERLEESYYKEDLLKLDEEIKDSILENRNDEDLVLFCNIYKVFVSNGFRLSLLGGIVLLSFFIYLLNKSFGKTLKTDGIVFIVASVISLAILGLFIYFMIDSIEDFKFTFNSVLGLRYAIIGLILGIVLVVVGNNMKNKTIKEKMA